MRRSHLLFITAAFVIISTAVCCCDAALFDMTKVFVKNATQRGAIANDNSSAIFFFGPSITASTPEKADTIIMLQGGWSCDGAKSCAARFQGAPKLMSSKPWPDTHARDDYLSADPLFNPAFYNHNVIYAPYVSSDFWVGTANATTEIPWTFHGSAILRSIIEDLATGFTDVNGKRYKNMICGAGRRVVLSGLSAGAIGTLLNAKPIEELVQKLCGGGEQQAPVKFSALVDSGLFMGFVDPLETHTPQQCKNDPMQCSYRQECEVGYSVWQAQLDATCVAQQGGASKAHQCMFGEVAARYAANKTFFASYLFDAAAIAADGIFDLLNTTDLAFLAKLTVARRLIFQSHGSSWSPSCVGHIVAAKAATLTAGGMSLSTALALWHNDNDKATYLDKCSVPGCRKKCK